MTERESIIAGFSPSEMEQYLSRGGSIPAASMRVIRQRLGKEHRRLTDKQLANTDWTFVVATPMSCIPTSELNELRRVCAELRGDRDAA